MLLSEVFDQAHNHLHNSERDQKTCWVNDNELWWIQFYLATAHVTNTALYNFQTTMYIHHSTLQASFVVKLNTLYYNH